MNNTKYAFSNGIGPLPYRGDGRNIGAQIYTYLHLNKPKYIYSKRLYYNVCSLNLSGCRRESTKNG